MKELDTTFEGVGEMKGYRFYQLKADGNAYLYELTDYEGNKHYEIFERRINTQFNNVSYPKSKAFGVWAWCANSLNRAVAKFNEVSLRVQKKK